MKKLTAVILFLTAILIISVGCSKENTVKKETQVNKELIGTWRHQEVPTLPYYNTWLITFNEDGTYITQSDTYETADNGTTSLTESFGAKGSYTLVENKILFESDTGKSRIEPYEIIQEKDGTQLVFKDSNGNNKSSVGVGGVTYDLIFIKEN